MDNMNLYYDLLGLNQSASLEDVEQAYGDLLGVFTKYQISHDPEFRLNAGEQIKKIKIAYDEVKAHLFKPTIKTLK
jgi:curved DNA-binding protein CbpA